ncbi:MAG: LegC family aminotransferase [Alphaproteobacteria bacterium]
MLPLTQSDSLSAAEQLIPAIRSVIGSGTHPLHEPLFTGKEKEYVTSCIEEGWVSSVGSFVDRFEKDVAAACGAQHAVAVVNGTAALHMALVASGLQPGEEVLIPSLTFVATANAVMHAGGVPHFVDVEESSLGICPEALDAYLKSVVVQKEGAAVNRKTQARIRALLPVHVFGHPCQVQRLLRVAQYYGLAFIEDATEALGSTYQDKKVGSEHTAIISFNGNKILTTGGGGAVVTNNAGLAQRIKHLTTQAKEPHKWDFSHDAVGWNYRLPNLNAALGCAQLEQLDGFVAAKRKLADRYMQAFAGIEGVHFLKEPANTRSNYWLNTLVTDRSESGWMNETLAALHEDGLLCRPVWRPLHQLPMYAGMPRSDLRFTENLAQRIISLPSSVKLAKEM